MMVARSSSPPPDADAVRDLREIPRPRRQVKTSRLPRRHLPGRTASASRRWRAIDSIEWVAVHDAARPLVSQALIDRTFQAALAHGAAAAALAVHLTIKQAAGPLPARVQANARRHDLWAMQTPQAMRRQDLLDAFACLPDPAGSGDR